MLLLLVAILGLSVLGAVSLGSSRIPVPRVAGILWNGIAGGGGGDGAWSAGEEAIVLMIRLPRVLLAGLVGAALATSGVILQGLFRNPLADPFTIGVSSGAAVGAVAAIAVGLPHRLGGGWVIPVAAFAGALIAAVAVYALASIGGRVPVLVLLLSGVVVSSFLSAIISFILTVTGESLRQALFWMMGSLGTIGWRFVPLLTPYVLLGGAVGIGLARQINALVMGEETAASLGVDVERLKRIILATASLLTGAAVAVSGMIGFVGLIVPHSLRLLLGPDHRLLIPASFLGGGIFLIWVDVAARIAVPPSEVPVGVVTALLGAPFFFYLLRRRRKEFMF